MEELRLLVEGLLRLVAERDGKRRREHVREEDGADDAAAEGRAVGGDVDLELGEAAVFEYMPPGICASRISVFAPWTFTKILSYLARIFLK